MKINKDEDLLKLVRYLHNEKIKLKKENRLLEKDNDKLNAIIKEAREYIKKNYPVCAGSELLEILDKVEENK